MEPRCPHCDSPVTQAEQEYCLNCGIELPGQAGTSRAELSGPTTQPAEPAVDQAAVDTTRTEALVSPSAEPLPSLKIKLPTGDEYIKQIAKPQVRLGKGPHNDIVIADASVSSAHALIAQSDNGYTISDLGSRNGTFVNRERVVEPRPLRTGDMINLGRSRLTFQSSPGGDTVALPPIDLAPPTLVGVAPDGNRIERVIDRSEIGLGKGPHNQVVIGDPTVSTAHAAIVSKAGEYCIVDLGSRNGTYVNGEQLGREPRLLKHGDTIRIGVTVLSFRDPSRAAETTTALPSELVAQIGRRSDGTGESSAAAAGAEGVAQSSEASGADATHVASPGQIDGSPATAAAAEKDKAKKSDKDKKKKKKKEKDERLRAAYIGALGRVVAAVLSVILTVGIALYIKDGGLTGKTEVTAGSKGKAKLKLGALGAGTAISGGNFRASGIVQVPDSNGVLIVDRSNSRQVIWMQLDDSGRQVGAARPVDLGVTIDDPEGITYGEHFFYVVGSQSNPKAAAANALVRFAFDPSAVALKGAAEAVADLRSLLLKNVPDLKSVGEDEKGGLSVEGIAWDPDHERLLLGLRSPVANGKALVVPIKIRDPRTALSGDNLQFAEPASLQLPLGGLGLCDIQYDSRVKSFVIIAGESSSLDRKGLELWEWDGNPVGQDESAIRKDRQLDEKLKIAGVSRLSIGQHDWLLVVGDSGSYSKIDYSKAE